MYVHIRPLTCFPVPPWQHSANSITPLKEMDGLLDVALNYGSAIQIATRHMGTEICRVYVNSKTWVYETTDVFHITRTFDIVNMTTTRGTKCKYKRNIRPSCSDFHFFHQKKKKKKGSTG